VSDELFGASLCCCKVGVAVECVHTAMMTHNWWKAEDSVGGKSSILHLLS
jgi:hypothetical protein